MNGIITLPLVPLRQNDSEISEMTSQLLFGERVEIEEVNERWLFVRNLSDNYTGWVDRKMIQILSNHEEKQLNSVNSFCMPIPLVLCNIINTGEKMYIPGGSILHGFTEHKCKIGDEIYEINLQGSTNLQEITSERILYLATQYLNAPYLWGGKTIMGIDCSGFVQVIYALCQIQLPRDASMQVEKGQVIDFLSQSQAGDLAFFENAEGKIIHVGLLYNNHQIIHASGWVKIESIDTHGIISSKTGEYTHKLRVIKRLI
jgi:hypothetical protein